MNLSAKALDKKGCLFDSCREVILRPSNYYEAELLAVLVRATLNGGVITVEATGDRSSRIFYMKDEAAEKPTEAI